MGQEAEKQQEITYSSYEELVEMGAELVNSKDMEDVSKAKSIFEHLLLLDRENVGVLFSLASCYMRQRRVGLAEHLYRRCIEMDQNFAPSFNNLGYVLNLEGRNDEALKYFSRAIEIDPKQSEFYNNMATGYVNTGKPEQCLEWCAKALEIDPNNRDAQWNAGLAHLELGHWKEGWEGYRAGLSDTPGSSQQRKVRHYVEEGKVPYWDGTKGQTVVVYGEQGVGDEIMAASVFPEACEDVDIIYEAHPRLVDIMRHTFGNKFPIYGTRKVHWKELTFTNWHQIDAQAPIFNLLQFYRQKTEDFPRKPYLKPYEDKVEFYRGQLAKLGDKPKIGFSWKGGSVATRKDLRSLPLQQWVDFLRSVDVDWISVQYDPADSIGHNTPIVASFEKEFDIKLHHWGDVINDLDECYGGLINALDLVISVNTSIVHACGAFGVPCWTLTPSQPAWRYQMPGANPLGDDKMIWYGDHVRQFRQQGDDWRGVLGEVSEELQKLLAASRAA